MDEEPAIHEGTSSSDGDGGLLHTTEMEGGSSYEDWYPHDRVVGCSVCASANPVNVRLGHRECPPNSAFFYEGFIAGATIVIPAAARTTCT